MRLGGSFAAFRVLPLKVLVAEGVEAVAAAPGGGGSVAAASGGDAFDPSRGFAICLVDLDGVSSAAGGKRGDGFPHLRPVRSG